MPRASNTFDQMVTDLVPSLSRSLAEQFNVFRVMHHGTHEKQLSNVFAWLLRVDESHKFGDTFQRLFIEQVHHNLQDQGLPAAPQLPTTGYRVAQEVNTSGHEENGGDIADIVLTSETATIVIENYETSDGHKHDYHRYRAYDAVGERKNVVVLLCVRRESHRQVDGWEQAVVVTYEDLLKRLKTHIDEDKPWQRNHPQQNFFINELIHHFMEDLGAMSNEDRIAFIKTMCETGESARYGHQPQDVAAQEFADLLAQHAKHQFEEGRRALTEVKRALKRYTEHVLMGRVNETLTSGKITLVRANLRGKWEWCVTLERADSKPLIFLTFGPTVALQNSLLPTPLGNIDYIKIFVSRKAVDNNDTYRIVQTDVGLDEVLAGLNSEDDRLFEDVLAVIRAT